MTENAKCYGVGMLYRDMDMVRVVFPAGSNPPLVFKEETYTTEYAQKSLCIELFELPYGRRDDLIPLESAGKKGFSITLPFDAPVPRGTAVTVKITLDKSGLLRGSLEYNGKKVTRSCKAG